MSRVRYYHLEDGEWFRVTLDKTKVNREQCCDCAAIHDTEFRKVGNHIEWRSTYNRKATAAARRAFKFTKE